jgi:hypothetical protein
MRTETKTRKQQLWYKVANTRQRPTCAPPPTEYTCRLAITALRWSGDSLRDPAKLGLYDLYGLTKPSDLLVLAKEFHVVKYEEYNAKHHLTCTSKTKTPACATGQIVWFQQPFVYKKQ